MKKIKNKKTLTSTTNSTLFLKTRNGIFKISDSSETRKVSIIHLTSEQYIKQKSLLEGNRSSGA